jgi:hypothetical protein
MVVEVTSPTSAREDLLDKKAQYASAGIPLYLVVVMDEKYEITEIREFHLDAATADYRLHAVHASTSTSTSTSTSLSGFPCRSTTCSRHRRGASGRCRPSAPHHCRLVRRSARSRGGQ